MHARSDTYELSVGCHCGLSLHARLSPNLRAVPEPSVPTASQSIDYTKLRQDFVRAVARLCPSWLASQRDDLVQAAVMRVMHIVSKQTSSGGDAAFASSYLYRVAHSALVDEMRRMTRRQETAWTTPRSSEPP